MYAVTDYLLKPLVGMSFWKLPESILYQSQHQLLTLDCKLSLGITLLNKSLYSDILTSDLSLHERKIVLNYEILMDAFGEIVKRLINWQHFSSLPTNSMKTNVLVNFHFALKYVCTFYFL